MLRILTSICTAAVTAVLLAAALPDAAAAGECERKVARAASVQGRVEVKGESDSAWRPAKRNELFCPGDRIRVLENSRALLVLANETIVRLDQNSTITLRAPGGAGAALLDLLRGVAYFFSRTPQGLTVTTPFVNAAIEGTEFLMRVGDDDASVTVFEGRVAATNDKGTVTLTDGQSVLSEKGKAPVLALVARPRDAVRWALYYPPLVPALPADLESVPAGDWRARASFLLSVGRVDEARGEIDKALAAAPGNAEALALQSVIAVSRNEKKEALDLSGKAVASDPASGPARIARSYAQQASFDIGGARATLLDAVRREPGNSLAWARLAEIHMSFGDLDRALSAAREAVSRDPSQSRTQTVLGFAALAEVETKEARDAFEKAIERDQADPLPRLGMGLALIRDGRLAEGRGEIEIAAALDPDDSLARSYLGKAYYEEKRDRVAAGQFRIAETLDPNDPTPYFYDAIRKQSVNRPVEAMRDLQTSIALNDNRAVYRSKLLLDEDLAARSAGIARIYDDLGFQQLALVEGWTSVNSDPAGFSGHLFLADAYASIPRHEIARVSEVLQGQLLQPINVNPVPPRLAESRSLVTSGMGTGSASFNEFNTLFNRDRFALLATGIAGNERTLGDEVVQSGVAGKFSWSLGQSHFQTDGFRANDDLMRNDFDGFVQYALSHRTSVQAEIRSSTVDFGDRILRSHPDDFYPDNREGDEVRTYRFGFRHAFTPGAVLLGSFIGLEKYISNRFFFPGSIDWITDTTDRGQVVELQQIYRAERWNAVAGAGNAQTTSSMTDTVTFFLDPGPPPVTITVTNATDTSVRHTNAYLYSRIRLSDTLAATLGASVDWYSYFLRDRTQFNPKAGAEWTPLPGTTLRAAAFRVLKRTLVTDQTLEPTQVAGFNQFFDDTNGTASWLYGVAADQRISPDITGGAEYFRRDLDIPFLMATLSGSSVENTTVKQALGRAYLYWTPHPRWSVSAEYQYERVRQGLDFLLDGIDRVSSERFPVGINFFHPCGITARAKATYFAQHGLFVSTVSNPPAVPGSDYFWLFDASLGYRLPKRWGLVTVEGKNVFDHTFKFQDTDRNNPTIQPERTILVRLTLSI